MNSVGVKTPPTRSGPQWRVASFSGENREQPQTQQLSLENVANDAITVAPHLRHEDGDDADDESPDAKLPVKRQT